MATLTAAAEAIRSAHDKLLSLARTAQVTGDPSAPVLEALAAHVEAVHQLSEAPRRALTTMEIRQISSIALRGVGSEMARTMLKLTRWGVPGLALLFGIACGAALGVAGMIVFHQPQTSLPPLSCQAYQGGTFCGFWSVMPNPAR